MDELRLMTANTGMRIINKCPQNNDAKRRSRRIGQCRVESGEGTTNNAD
jgi:hypothetical protein